MKVKPLKKYKVELEAMLLREVTAYSWKEAQEVAMNKPICEDDEIEISEEYCCVEEIE